MRIHIFRGMKRCALRTPTFGRNIFKSNCRPCIADMWNDVPCSYVQGKHLRLSAILSPIREHQLVHVPRWRSENMVCFHTFLRAAQKQELDHRKQFHGTKWSPRRTYQAHRQLLASLTLPRVLLSSSDQILTMSLDDPRGTISLYDVLSVVSVVIFINEHTFKSCVKIKATAKIVRINKSNEFSAYSGDKRLREN